MWLDNAGEKIESVAVTTETRLRSPYIKVECTGKQINPFENDTEGEFGFFMTNLLKTFI